MATLRDFVTPNKIKAPSQNNTWVEIEFTTGAQGSTGVELGNCHFNMSKMYYSYNIEYEANIEMQWEKIHNYPAPVPQAFYPIMSFALDLNNPTTEGAIQEIGEGVWYDTALSSGRDNILSGGLANYKATTHLTGGDFSRQSYTFEQYMDDENNYVRSEDFSAPARWADEPANTIYWYNPNSARNYLADYSFIPPYQITGNTRIGLQEVFNMANAYDTRYTEATPCHVTVDTNVPIIVWDYDYYSLHFSDINSAMHSYLSDGDLSRFAQYISDGHAVMSNAYVTPSVTEGTKQYNMYCDIYNGYWDVDEVTNETLREYRYLEIWVAPTATQQTEARASLYKNKVGSELRCNIKVYGDIKQIRYSTDGGNNWTTEENPQGLPWEYLFYKRTDELRFLTYDKNHGGNMLLFDTEALADDGSPWLASDYNEKNFYYPTSNETGTPENSTLMGTTGLRSVFSKKYVVNYSDLTTIANQLFTSGGMVEDLKKGLEMFGNPIEAIQGLMYFPFDLANYFSLVTSSTVIVGGYEMQGTSAKLLTAYNGYFDIGSIEIKESFPSGDYRNYEPYCNLSIFLPFVGLQSLKLNKYVGKTMSIRYYLDATTGEVMACCFANGLLADYWTGQAGVNLPISLHDYAQFAGASMQALSNIAEGGANALVGTATGDVGKVAQGVTGFEGSLFNLKQNSINNFVTTKGTSSSLLNHYLPNYVYVIFEIVETDETANLLTVEGRRTNASGNIGAFSGFLQVESVKLNCSGATESEKTKIKDLLSSGIYI